MLLEFRQSNTSILAINDANDKIVTPNNAQLIVNVSNHKASRVYVINNVDHVFDAFNNDSEIFNDLLTKTINWYSAQLNALI